MENGTVSLERAYHVLTGLNPTIPLLGLVSIEFKTYVLMKTFT